MNFYKNVVLPLHDWVDYRLPVFSYVRENLVDYPTPKKFKLLVEFWSFTGNNPDDYDHHRYILSFQLHTSH
jgi:hypothetical protein